MLSCIIGNKSINSFDYEESKLREWSNKQILRCPECDERVIYCKGDYKIPYFKHEVASDCVGNKYYEPMTEEHVNGIKTLYERLKNMEGIENLEVEKYIKNTKQRPDIYFEYKGERYCIEYQCSPISTQYNKRHELYELEGIKDIWILGTEKYNFEGFIETDKHIKFKEKKIKAIEDEIDRGEYPLLYIKDDNIYKINDIGFTCIHRWNSRYETFKENILKTKVGLTLNKYKIDNVKISDLVLKPNKNIKEIIKRTNDVIVEAEGICRDILKKYNKSVKFMYSLDNDRFPCWKINVLRNFEIYGDQNGKRLLSCLNSYIELVECVKEYINIYNDKNKGRYCARIEGEKIIARNIEEQYDFFIGYITDIILTYAYREKKSNNYIDYLEDIKRYIKKEIISDKRKTTMFRNNLIKEENKEYNIKTIKKVIEDLNGEIDNYIFKYDDNEGINICGTKRWIWFDIKSSKIDYEYIVDKIRNKVELLKIENMILKEIKRIEKHVKDVKVDFDLTHRINITLEKSRNNFAKSHIDLQIDYNNFNLKDLKQISNSISDEIRRVRYGQV